MKKKISVLCFVMVVTMIVSMFQVGAADKSRVEIGDYVELGTYEGKPILWQVIHKTDNGYLVWSDKVLNQFSFGAERIDPTFGERYGSSWESSTIRQWLNSEEQFVIYASDEPNMKYSEVPYDMEPGFLTSFTDFEKTMIGDYNYLQSQSPISFSFYKRTDSIETIMKQYGDMQHLEFTDKVVLLSMEEMYDYVYRNDMSIVKVDLDGNPSNHRTRDHNVFGGYNNIITVDGKVTNILENGEMYGTYYGAGLVPAMNINLILPLMKGDGSLENPFRLSRYLMSGEIDYTEASGWAVDAIKEAEDKEYLPESLRHDFKQNISREEFSELVVDVYEFLTETSIEVTIDNPYTDTESEAVLKATQLGVVNGVGKGIFSPKSDITREQMATMFYRMLSLDEFELEDFRRGLEYDDTDTVASYATTAAEYFNHYGIINGVGNNKFSPKGTSSKQQAIVIATRIINGFDDFLAEGEYPSTLKIGNKGEVVKELAKKVKDYQRDTQLVGRASGSVYNELMAEFIDDLQLDFGLKTSKTVDKAFFEMMEEPFNQFGKSEIARIKDKSFESVVREACDKESGTLYTHDLLKVRDLSVEDYSELEEVKTFDGIEQLVNLKYLDLSTVKVNDLIELEGLNRLEELHLGAVRAEDIVFTKDLENLERLYIKVSTFDELKEDQAVYAELIDVANIELNLYCEENDTWYDNEAIEGDLESEELSDSVETEEDAEIEVDSEADTDEETETN